MKAGGQYSPSLPHLPTYSVRSVYTIGGKMTQIHLVDLGQGTDEADISNQIYSLARFEPPTSCSTDQYANQQTIKRNPIGRSIGAYRGWFSGFKPPNIFV